MDTSVLKVAGRRRRRKHSADFKAELIEACQQPGVSSAAIALANGLNANMLRRWVNDAEQRRSTVIAPSLAPSSRPALGVRSSATACAEAAGRHPHRSSTRRRQRLGRLAGERGTGVRDLDAREVLR